MQTTPAASKRFPYPPEMAQAFAEMARANAVLSEQQQATELQLRRTAAQQEITAVGLAELRESTNALRESTMRMGEQLGGMVELRESTNALRESTMRMGEQLGGMVELRESTNALRESTLRMGEQLGGMVELRESTNALRESTMRMGEQLGGMVELRESTNALRESTKRMGEQLGGISNNQGAVAEDFFYNSLLERPQVGPFKFSKIVRNSLVGTKGHQTEYDLLLVNGKCVVVVEVKYKLHPAHVDHLDKQIKAFKRDHAEFKGFEVYGALAGLSVPHAVRAAATERGYMLLQRKGELLHAVTEGLRVQ